ncbi:MAG: TerB family tellurite resistance protein [Bacteroidetes bacterium]|nr:TerB family tellurite resistance protein [Bacteroidota bacterium]
MPTQFITKMNKTEAGFHLLMTLSLADGSIQQSESKIILDFLEKNYSEPIDLIKEQAFLRALPEEERQNHFHETAIQFYKISSAEDRNKIIEFAMKVVMADKRMETGENAYINELYDAWDLA